MKSVISAASAVALVAISVSGCGTIIQGTTQDIAITSSPSGARCDLDRNSERVATVAATPARAHVDKAWNNIAVTCTKRGYQTASANLESGPSIGLFGNLLIGGVIGVGIDVATGGAYKYPSSADLQFVPLQGDAAAQVALEGNEATQLAARSLCTSEDWKLARLSEQNPYAAVRMVCN